jgi:single-stranded-DNA-specific exonuclease
MEDAKLALDLCLVDDAAAAAELAAQLDVQNRRRQQAVSEVLAAAEELVAGLDDDLPALVLGSDSWSMGVVGLVAGRLAERYARPAFVVCLDPAEAKGSARSIPGVHIVQALDAAAPALIRYGGHVAAAGFSLEASRFDEFRELVCAGVARQPASTRRERLFAIDSDVTAGEATPGLCRALDQLEPCGQGNPPAVLALRGARVLGASPFGTSEQHVRVVLAGDTGVLEATAFFKPHLVAHLPRGRMVDACFSLEVDSWQGQERVRARLRDLRPAQAPADLAATG